MRESRRRRPHGSRVPLNLCIWAASRRRTVRTAFAQLCDQASPCRESVPPRHDLHHILVQSGRPASLRLEISNRCGLARATASTWRRPRSAPAPRTPGSTYGPRMHRLELVLDYGGLSRAQRQSCRYRVRAFAAAMRWLIQLNGRSAPLRIRGSDNACSAAISLRRDRVELPMTRGPRRFASPRVRASVISVTANAPAVVAAGSSEGRGRRGFAPRLPRATARLDSARRARPALR